MSRSQCLLNSSSAVLRVLRGRVSADYAAAAAATAPQLPRFLLPVVYASPAPSRPFSSINAHLRARPAKVQVKARLPRDYEITHDLVYIRGDDGLLSEPRYTSAVLASLDLQTYSLTVVALPQEAPEVKKTKTDWGEEEEVEGSGSSGSAEERGRGRKGPRAGLQYPICRIIDKKAEHSAALAQAKAERKKAVTTKEVEVNWAIAPHDLETKARRLKEFLGKGFKVQVVLLSRAKRSKRRASADEAKEVLEKLREAIGEIPGAKEYKAMEGAVGGQARLFVEGPRADSS